MQVVSLATDILILGLLVYAGFWVKAQSALLKRAVDVLNQLTSAVSLHAQRESEIQYLREQSNRLQQEILAVKSPIAFTKVHGRPEPLPVRKVSAEFIGFGESFEMPPEFDRPV